MIQLLCGMSRGKQKSFTSAILLASFLSLVFIYFNGTTNDNSSPPPSCFSCRATEGIPQNFNNMSLNIFAPIIVRIIIKNEIS